jgi:hypothetical protein
VDDSDSDSDLDEDFDMESGYETLNDFLDEEVPQTTAKRDLYTAVHDCLLPVQAVCIGLADNRNNHDTVMEPLKNLMRIGCLATLPRNSDGEIEIEFPQVGQKLSVAAH